MESVTFTIKPGDYVVSKTTHEVAVVTRLGHFPGLVSRVFRVEPSLDGEHWKSIDQVDILL